MKTTSPRLLTSAFRLLALFALLTIFQAPATQAATFTWDGTNNLWNSLHWNPGLTAGPTGSSNADSAIINGGTVSFAGNDTFGDANTTTSPVVTVNSGGTLASGGFFNTIWNLNLNSGTVALTGGVNASYPAFQFAGTLTATGISNINVVSGGFNAINIGGSGNNTLTMNVVNASDALNVNAPLQNNPSGASSLTKSGLGTLTLSGANTYTGATGVNAGILVFGNKSAKSSGSTVTALAAGTVGLGVGAGGVTDYSISDVATLFNTGQLGGATGINLNAASGVALDTTAGNFTQSTALTAARALTKLGANTLTLTVANTYTGATTINAGTLAITGGGTIANNASNTITINNGGTFSLGKNNTWGDSANGAPLIPITINAGGVMTNSGFFNTLGALTLNGGTLTSIAGVNATFGSWALRGTVTVGGSVASTISQSGTNANINLGAGTVTGTTFNVADATGNANTDLLVSAVLQNGANASNVAQASSLTKTGVGTMTLSGENTYTGTTTISLGTLQIGAAGTAGSITTTSNVVDSGALVFNRTDTYGGNFTPVISGSGSLTLANGTLTLTGANTYTGATTVTAGTLQINGSFAGTNGQNTTALLNIGNASGGGNVIIGSGAGILNFGGDGYNNAAQVSFNGNTVASTLTMNGGTVNIAGAGGTAAALNISVSSAAAGTVTVNNGTLNVGSRILMGANTAGANGTLTINGGSVNVGYNGGFGFSGNESGIVRMGGFTTAVNLNGGTLSLFAFESDSGTAANTVINFNGGTLKALGSPTNFLANGGGGAVGVYTTKVKVGGAVIDTNTFSITIPTALVFDPASTGGGLTKKGLGNLTLTAANTYTGNTLVQNGTLTINGGTIAGPGLIDIGSVGASQVDYVQTSGNVTAGGQFVVGAHGSNSNSSIAAGTLQVNGPIFIGGYGEGTGTGTFTQTGGTVVSTVGVDFGGSGPNSGVYNLNGGTLTVPIIYPNGAGTHTFNFNGGTLKTSATSATFMQGLTAANVKLGGALINTNSFDITIGQTLLHDAGLGATLDGGLTKQGLGTLTLSNTNTYTGKTVVQNGTLSFSAGNASATADQQLGKNVALDLGVLSTSAGTLLYTGGTGTLAKNVNALSSQNNTIENNGGGILTISGTLAKNGTTLVLKSTNAGSGFIVSNAITGASANSDLIISGGTTILNAANTYVGPTFVNTGGILQLGINNAIPSNSAVTLGDATTTGTLDMQTFTNSIGSLAFGAGGGTVKMQANTTLSAQLAASGTVVLGSTNTINLTGMQTTAGLYRLISGSSLNGTFGTVTGLNSGYSLVYSLTELDAQHKADQSFSLTTPAGTPRALVSTNVSLSGTLTNTAPVGSANLVAALSSTGALTVGSLTSSTGGTVAVGTPSTITGSIATGATAGTFGWQVTNTDANAVTTASTISGSINVINQRTFSVGTDPIALGTIHAGTASGGSSIISSTGLNAVTANATLGAFAGTNNQGLTLTTGDPTLFDGASSPQTATYNIGGTATAGVLTSASFSSTVGAELGAISNVVVNVTGSVFNGDATWTGAGNSWGTGASANWVDANGVNAAPGTFAAFANVDSATFNGAGANFTANLNGTSPSIKTLNFASATSYTIAPGTSGTLTFDGGAAINVTSGNHTISAPVLLNSNLAIVGSASTQLTVSGQISGGNALTVTGPGTTVLSNLTGNTYSGGTTVNGNGVLLAKNNTSGSATGTGAVSVASGATLGGTGFLTAASLNITSGGALMVGDTHGSGVASELSIGSTVGNLTLGGMVQFDIFSRTGTGSYAGPNITGIALTKYATNSNDLLRFSTLAGTLSVTGALQVASNISGTFALGDTWLLTDWNLLTHSAAFSTFVLPTLGTGLVWDIATSPTNFDTFGTITVVPEPSRAILMLFGAAGLLIRRRRK